MIDLSENMELFKDVGTKNFKIIHSLAQLNLKSWNKLAQKQMEVFSLVTDASINSLKPFTESLDVQEIAMSQAELRKQFGEELNGKSEELVEMTTEVRDEYIAFAQEQFSDYNLNFNVVKQIS